MSAWSLVLLLFFARQTHAQLIPPSTATQWNVLTNGNWITASNWSPASAPNSANVDVLFAKASADDLAVRVLNNQNRSLRSLWFDADKGVSYTLTGLGTLTLGANLPDDAHLITVLGQSGLQAQSQGHINIELPLSLASNLAGRYRRIENYSLAGLRLGGPFALGSQHLRVGGVGVTHIAGNLTSSANSSTVSRGNIFLQNPDPNAGIGTLPTQLILSGDNSGWSGGLYLDTPQIMAIFRNPNAMPPSGIRALRATSGGSFVLRGSGTYGEDRSLELAGEGTVRQAQYARGIGALYFDGGDGIIYNGQLRLLGNTQIGARGDAGGVFLNGEIDQDNKSNRYSLTKTGLGLVSLGANNNAWGGQTRIDAGALRVTTSGALPSTSNILLNGGVLELGYGSTRHGFKLGPETGQITWGKTLGGFSAYGGDRNVTLNGGSALIWGQENFVGNGYALLFGSRYSDSVITLTNPLVLIEEATHEIRVDRGSPAAYASLRGNITARSPSPIRALLKTGSGMLELQGKNSYGGLTIIGDGALRGNLPKDSNIRLDGGVLGLDSHRFTADLGTEQGQLHWNSSGGFAAYGGDRTVSLNNGATITWGSTPHFVQNGQELRFGHYTATGTVIWDTPINLGADQTRTIYVERGRNANIADVVFTQLIYNPNAVKENTQLIIKGDGRVDFSFGTPSQIEGVTTIDIYGAELRLTGNSSLNGPAQLSQNYRYDINIKNGGTLTLDGGDDRLGAPYTTRLILNSSTVRYIGSPSETNIQFLNALGFFEGASTIELKDSSLRTNFFSYPYFNTQTLNYIYEGGSSLIFPTDTGGVLPWMTVNSQDWAIAPSVGAPILAFTDYYTGTAFGNTHAHITNNRNLTSDISPRSLKLGNATINMNGHKLEIDSGGLLTYIGTPTIHNAKIYYDELAPRTTNYSIFYIHVYSDSLTLTGSSYFSAEYFYRPSIKTGGGSLILNSNNTHGFGDLYIYQGAVILQKGSISATRINIGDGAGRDILILPGNRTDPLVNKPYITLRGTPYRLDPSHVYGGAESEQAILQFGGNTRQHIFQLQIIDRGTIDFVGGEAGLPNILWIDDLTFSGNPSARLFIRNWYEKEDYLLVRKNGHLPFEQSLLPQFIFDGYQDYTVQVRYYDKDYWEITPFTGQFYTTPEPSTYGLILGGVGLGLWSWRRRRRLAAPPIAHS